MENIPENHKFLARSKGKQRISKSIPTLNLSLLLCTKLPLLCPILPTPPSLPPPLLFYTVYFPPLTLVFIVQTAEHSLFEPFGGYWLTRRVRGQQAPDETEALFLSFLPPDYRSKTPGTPGMKPRLVGDVEYNRMCPAKEEHISADLLKVKFWHAPRPFSLSTLTPWQGWYGAITVNTFHGRLWRHRGWGLQLQTRDDALPGNSSVWNRFNRIWFQWCLLIFCFLSLFPFVCISVFGGGELMVLLQRAIISSKSTTRLQKHHKLFSAAVGKSALLSVHSPADLNECTHYWLFLLSLLQLSAYLWSFSPFNGESHPSATTPSPEIKLQLKREHS